MQQTQGTPAFFRDVAHNCRVGKVKRIVNQMDSLTEYALWFAEKKNVTLGDKRHYVTNLEVDTKNETVRVTVCDLGNPDYWRNEEFPISELCEDQQMFFSRVN